MSQNDRKNKILDLLEKYKLTPEQIVVKAIEAIEKKNK